MIIYDQTSIAFIQRSQEVLRDILVDLKIPVKKSRFLFNNYLYPIKVVVFDGTDLGHFNAPFYQIGLNKKLIYLAKDSVVRDILKHELAHYLTWIKFGHVSSHGPEFKETCRVYGFTEEVSAATINLQEANLSKEGDLESEKVLEKAKKLLQLAQSSNSHEAELATMKANALLLRHNLDHIKTDDDVPVFMERVLFQKRKDAKMAAIYDILRHFLVKPVISFGRGICCIEITGTKTNLKLALYIVEFLEREFDHLWEIARKEHRLSGLRSKNSFFLGIAKGFDQKMTSNKMELSPDDQKGLVLVEKNLNTRIRQIYGKLSSSTSSHQSDERAGAVGVMKGKDLTIRKGVESYSKGLSLPFLKSK
jgi:hypothetical protein